MKLYSDKLDVSAICRTVGEVNGIFIEKIGAIKGSRIRSRGWNIVTSGTTNRWKNSGKNGASHVYAASCDAHGEWFNLLYKLDSEAVIVGCGRYNNAEDFHRKTLGKYRKE